MYVYLKTWQPRQSAAFEETPKERFQFFESAVEMLAHRESREKCYQLKPLQPVEVRDLADEEREPENAKQLERRIAAVKADIAAREVVLQKLEALRATAE